MSRVRRHAEAERHRFEELMVTPPDAPVPFAAQAVPFHEFLASGKLPEGLITSDYIAEQFVERLVHYVLSIPAGSFNMAGLGQLLEQL
ncbi:MAG: hypothetical protein FVQ76_11430, partial [Nitrospira sp.]|nr:hypothetical protein [Nitrospira sp.]